jgi:PASTA domain
MSTEEERLARLLKRVVPEPPGQLSADQITTRSAGPSARSWMVPTLAAAAVAAIGVTVGLVAAHQSPAGGAPAPQALSASSARPSPQTGATCQGRTVTVPNVVGVTQDAALAIIQDAGLNVGAYNGVPPASARISPGSVSSQSLPAGSKAVPGALVWLEIASAPSTSTAAPIDPGMVPTATPTAQSSCQGVVGTPPASNARMSVPNVVGMGASQARDAASAAGLSVSTVITAAPASQSVAPGTVFAQSPVAGSSALPGSGMILYVAPAS